MKILHIYDHTEPLQSGYVLRSCSLRKALEAQGHTCHIVSMPKHYANGFHIHYKNEVEQIDQINYFRSKPNKLRLPILRELYDIYIGAMRIKNLIQAHDYDILHAHSPSLCGLAALCGRLLSGQKNIKIVYEIRAFWEDAALDHQQSKAEHLGTLGIKYKLTRWLESLTCHYVDHIYPITTQLKMDLIQRNIPNTKITVIPNIIPEGILSQDPDPKKVQKLRDHYGIQTDDYILGFIGSFYAYEGLEDLIPIMKIFKQSKNPIKLLLVGGGPTHLRIKELIETEALEDHIILSGRVHHDETIHYYGLCHMMIYPRRSMRLTELVTPLKPLEAAAARVPVILSKIGGHCELLKDQETAFFINDFRQPQAVSKRILEIIEDQETSKNIVKNAYEMIKSERQASIIAQKYYQWG